MSSKEAIAPKLGDKVVAQVAASPVVPLEYEILYPSSDLTASERLELDVRYDGERVKHSMPSAVQLVVKALAVLRDRKTKNDRKQKDNARVGDGPNTSYSPLTEADTFMKSVRQARRVGDSRFTGGLLWRISGLASQSQIAPATSAGGSINTTGLSGTQMDTGKSATGTLEANNCCSARGQAGRKTGGMVVAFRENWQAFTE
ncbi:hypothetical protein B0H13DRAFT_1897007 [Mycena leptocephala]|nr:hypothetical protein B0H13DRAFT_1897007 [Mycena leptocephala]